MLFNSHRHFFRYRSDRVCGSGRSDDLVSCKDLLTYCGYNVVLVTRDRMGAAALSKGRQISFVGLPHRYTFRLGRPTVLTLREGLLIPSK